MMAIPFAHEVGFSPILQAFDSQLTAHTHKINSKYDLISTVLYYWKNQ